MADKKITALTASTALSTDDLFHVVDSPASSPSNKKITANNVFQKIPTWIGFNDTVATSAADSLAIPITASIVHKTTGGDAEALTVAAGTQGQLLMIVLITDGGGTGTIADGTMTGQVKYIIMKTDGGTGTLTGSNLIGASIIFADAGDGVTLLWTNSKWYTVSSSSGGPVYAAA